MSWLGKRRQNQQSEKEKKKNRAWNSNFTSQKWRRKRSATTITAGSCRCCKLKASILQLCVFSIMCKSNILSSWQSDKTKRRGWSWRASWWFNDALFIHCMVSLLIETAKWWRMWNTESLDWLTFVVYSVSSIKHEKKNRAHLHTFLMHFFRTWPISGLQIFFSAHTNWHHPRRYAARVCDRR